MHYPWHEAAFKRLLQRRQGLPHALLLRGIQGIGKRALAEALSRALLCEAPKEDGGFCGRCRACEWMEQGSHPDFRRLEPESLSDTESQAPGERREKPSSQITIEAVRTLGDFINVSSHRGGAKVVLIHPAEALNTNAANALLKSLEEPPPATYFLLVSHRWHQLLPTLKSRCQQVPLLMPSAQEAQCWLQARGLADPALALAHVGGAPLIAAEREPSFWEARRAFLASLGVASPDPISIVQGLGDPNPSIVLGWLQKWAYDLVSHQMTRTVRYNPDFKSAIAAAAGRIGRVESVRFVRKLIRLQRFVTHPLNPRLFLEDVLIDYVSLLRGRPEEGRTAHAR